MGGADVPSFPGSNAQSSLGLLYVNQQLSTAEVIDDCEGLHFRGVMPNNH